MMKESTTETDFIFVAAIGSGTTGDVTKAIEKSTGDVVALKKVKIINKEDGFPQATIKEISFLRNIQHPNVVRFRGLTRSSDRRTLCLVFDYCEFDLYALIHNSTDFMFSPHHVRCYFHQILLGLQACHSHSIIHRDLKPPNILLKPNNALVLSDFGLACKDIAVIGKCKTSKVITLWYRPPELLLGSGYYGSEIDIWSAGCILYEMITKQVLFQASFENDMEQLESICSICGVSSHSSWANLPLFSLLKKPTVTRSGDLADFLSKHIPVEFSEAKDLMLKLLEIDPKKRLTVSEALDHQFLRNHQDQLDPQSLPPISLPESHQSLGVSHKGLAKKAKRPEVPRPSAVHPQRA